MSKPYRVIKTCGKVMWIDFVCENWHGGRYRGSGHCWGFVTFCTPSSESMTCDLMKKRGWTIDEVVLCPYCNENKQKPPEVEGI